MESHKWAMNMIGIRSTYHFEKLLKIKKVDLYSGIFVGCNFVNYTVNTGSPNEAPRKWVPEDYPGGFTWAVYAGGCYYFIDRAGFFAEVGYGITEFNFGLNFKIVE